MRIELEHDFIRRLVDIYIIDDNAQTIISFDDDGLPLARKIEQGEKVDPSLRLPVKVAEALGPVLLDLAPPNAVQAEALKDTREVRDRLLSLVERIAQ